MEPAQWGRRPGPRNYSAGFPAALPPGAVRPSRQDRQTAPCSTAAMVPVSVAREPREPGFGQGAARGRYGTV